MAKNFLENLAHRIGAPRRYPADNTTDLGLTGFDSSSGGRPCDPSCSDSLNGATQRIANQQFALAA